VRKGDTRAATVSGQHSGESFETTSTTSSDATFFPNVRISEPGDRINAYARHGHSGFRRRSLPQYGLVRRFRVLLRHVRSKCAHLDPQRAVLPVMPYFIGNILELRSRLARYTLFHILRILD